MMSRRIETSTLMMKMMNVDSSEENSNSKSSDMSKTKGHWSVGNSIEMLCRYY